MAVALVVEVEVECCTLVSSTFRFLAGAGGETGCVVEEGVGALLFLRVGTYAVRGSSNSYSHTLSPGVALLWSLGLVVLEDLAGVDDVFDVESASGRGGLRGCEGRGGAT